MTPGLHEALAYLEGLRAADPLVVKEVPEEDGEDAADDTLYVLADQQATKPQIRHSPDELLNEICAKVGDA